MKERPIIFTAESVRAILDGRKTQTRRVVKATHHYGGGFPSGYTRALVGFHSPAPEEHLPAVFGASFRNDLGADWLIACPYGAPGHLLWVRERWHGDAVFDNDPAGVCLSGEIAFAADGDDKWLGRGKARSPWFLPRRASRLTLEVLSVRVERVQEISCSDAIAEGVTPTANSLTIDCDTPGPRVAYRSLWDSINGKKPGCSWADNPWCWVIEFGWVS